MKKCTPCETGKGALTLAEARKKLKNVKPFILVKDKMPKIRRDYKFKNFKDAMKFANKVAVVAEKSMHHPDILLFRWNNVRIEIYTHSMNGLSAYDFMLAKEINKIKV